MTDDEVRDIEKTDAEMLKKYDVVFNKDFIKTKDGMTVNISDIKAFGTDKMSGIETAYFAVVAFGNSSLAAAVSHYFFGSADLAFFGCLVLFAIGYFVSNNTRANFYIIVADKKIRLLRDSNAVVQSAVTHLERRKRQQQI